MCSMKFGIFSIVVGDGEGGEIPTDEHYAKDATAQGRATELRKSFKEVKVRPGTLEAGRPIKGTVAKHLRDNSE